MGAVSCDRDSFNPCPILSKINSGDRIITIDSNVDLPTNWRELNLFFCNSFVQMRVESNLYKWELNLIDLVDFEPGSTRVPNDFESEGTSDNAWSDNSSSDVGATLEEDHQNQHMSPGLSDMPVSPSVQDFFATTTSRFHWWYF